MKFIRKLISLLCKKKNTDGLLGEWGVWDTTTGESKIHGEMYSHNGRWIPGPDFTK